MRKNKKEKLAPNKSSFVILLARIFLLVWVFIVLQNYLKSFRNIATTPLWWLVSVTTGNEAPGLFHALGMHLINISFGVFFLLSALGWGKTILAKFPESDFSFFYAAGTGFGILIFLALLVGYAGFFQALPLGLFALAGIILFFYQRKKIKFQFPQKDTYLLIFFGILVLSLAGSLTPSTYYDSLVYHLSVPKRWLLAGRIFPIKYVTESYYPMNSEILFSYALAIPKYTASAKIINFIFFILTLGLIYELSFKLTKDKKFSYLASFIYGTTPFVILQTWRTGNELSQAFWELLAVCAFFEWSRKKEKKFLAFSGIFAGLALGTKHPATIMLFVFSLSFWIALFIQKRKLSAILKNYTFFLLFALAISSPWYLRNLFLTGNPLFPQFSGIISQFTATQRNDKPLTTDFPPVTNLKKIATGVWNVTMGKIESGHTGPFYLIFLPVIFFFRKKTFFQKFLFFYVVLYGLMWLTVGGQYFRRFIPALPVVSIFLALSVYNFLNFKRKNLIHIFCFAGMLYSLKLAAFFLKSGQDPWGFLLGKQSRIEYINTSRSTHPKLGGKLIDWANKNLPENATVLFLSEARPLYLNRNYIWSEVHEQTPLVEWCNTLKNADKVFEKFKKEKITHIFFSLPEHMRIAKSYNLYYFSEDGKKCFDEFWKKYVRFLHREDYSFLYEVLPEEQAALKPTPPNFILNPPKISGK